MDFLQMVSAYVGRSTEVLVTNQIVTGTLTAVSTTELQVQELPTVYSPSGTMVTILLRSVDYVRILP